MSEAAKIGAHWMTREQEHSLLDWRLRRETDIEAGICVFRCCRKPRFVAATCGAHLRLANADNIRAISNSGRMNLRKCAGADCRRNGFRGSLLCLGCQERVDALDKHTRKAIANLAERVERPLLSVKERAEVIRCKDMALASWPPRDEAGALLLKDESSQGCRVKACQAKASRRGLCWTAYQRAQDDQAGTVGLMLPAKSVNQHTGPKKTDAGPLRLAPPETPEAIAVDPVSTPQESKVVSRDFHQAELARLEAHHSLRFEHLWEQAEDLREHGEAQTAKVAALTEDSKQCRRSLSSSRHYAGELRTFFERVRDLAGAQDMKDDCMSVLQEVAHLLHAPTPPAPKPPLLTPAALDLSQVQPGVSLHLHFGEHKDWRSGQPSALQAVSVSPLPGTEAATGQVSADRLAALESVRTAAAQVWSESSENDYLKHQSAEVDRLAGALNRLDDLEECERVERAGGPS